MSRTFTDEDSAADKYACMHVCMYVSKYVCMCVCVYIYMYACMYVYVCICMYVCVCIYICMYVCVYVYIYIQVCPTPSRVQHRTFTDEDSAADKGGTLNTFSGDAEGRSSVYPTRSSESICVSYTLKCACLCVKHRNICAVHACECV